MSFNIRFIDKLFYTVGSYSKTDYRFEKGDRVILDDGLFWEVDTVTVDVNRSEIRVEVKEIKR